VLPDLDVRRLLADCSGKDFRDRRDLAIIRPFLDTGMRLDGMAGLRYSADDPEASDVDLRSRVVRIMPKGRRQLVLPIGAKAARDIDQYIRGARRSSARGRRLAVARHEGPAHGERRLSDDQGPGPRWVFPIFTRTSYGTRSRMTGCLMAGLRVT
jgi:site-specific recombinase XerC